MSGWTRHSGPVAVLARDNVDTDQLIPARFMSRSRAEGYGDFLLYDLRDKAEVARALDPVRRASVLVAGRNFGSGSSREAAVYALVDFGIRAVIAPSFGDIFAANAANNGLLALALPAEEIARLTADAGPGPSAEIDLAACTLRIGTETASFELAELTRTKLMNGWDDIDLTRDRAAEIAAFRNMRAQIPWVWPGPEHSP